jgi:hypothetical protein
LGIPGAEKAWSSPPKGALSATSDEKLLMTSLLLFWFSRQNKMIASFGFGRE